MEMARLGLMVSTRDLGTSWVWMFGCQKLRAMSLHHEKGRGESRSSQDMKKNGNPCGLRALLRKPGKEKIAIFSRFE